MIMEKPVEGQMFGCNDQNPPTQYTPYQLSRIADLLYSGHSAGLPESSVQKMFSSLPDAMKLEFNYSCWKYTKPQYIPTQTHQFKLSPLTNPRIILTICPEDDLVILELGQQDILPKKAHCTAIFDVIQGSTIQLEALSDEVYHNEQ